MSRKSMNLWLISVCLLIPTEKNAYFLMLILPCEFEVAENVTDPISQLFTKHFRVMFKYAWVRFLITNTKG